MEEIREGMEGQTCKVDIDHRAVIDSRRGVGEINKWEEARETPGGRRSARCGEHFGSWLSPSGFTTEGVCICSGTGWNTPGSHSSHTLDSFCTRVKWYARSHQ